MKAQKILLALLIAVGLSRPSPVAAQQEPLEVPFVEGVIPVDPEWNGWTAAPSRELLLLPQVIAQPWNLKPSITKLSVRALHNGAWISFRISWKDATRDAVMYTDKFRDAVALMVSVGKSAAITMGAPKERVLILHWKADWQEDIDKGFQDVARLYPNGWLDWYPFATGEPPWDITAWTNPEARRYMTGWVLGNARSQAQKRTAVEEQIADGYRTLATSERQSSVGKGVYDKGEWKVVIARPLVTGDTDDPSWGAGKRTLVAFAAWDGANGEIGSKKSYSNWVSLQIAPAGQIAPARK